METDSSTVRPKGLSELQLASLAVWFAAIGQWSHAGLSEAEACSFVMHFFKCLKPPHKNALRGNYVSLQNTFMAMRKGTFEAIQLEPPFSRFGRRNMKALLRGWLWGQEAEFTSTWAEIFPSGWDAKVSPELPVHVIESSGDDAESAIQILSHDAEDKINGEYWYLHYRYGTGWQVRMQTSTPPDANGCRFDILDIRFDGGNRRKFYFLL